MASFGKKKRRKRSSGEDSEQEDEVVVVQTIHITDKFGFDSESRKLSNSDSTRTIVESGKRSIFQNIANYARCFILCMTPICLNNKKPRSAVAYLAHLDFLFLQIAYKAFSRQMF